MTAETLYSNVLNQEGIDNLHLHQQNKFFELCQRTIADNPELDNAGKIRVAAFYLKTMLKNPESNI